MTDANKLAESLRAMRRNARRHYGPELGQTSYSITMDSTRLGDLSDAAGMLEKLAAEVERLNAPAVLLTAEEIRQAVRQMYASDEAADMGFSDDKATARLIESAALAANGKAVP